MKPGNKHWLALAFITIAQVHGAEVTLKAGGDPSPTSSFDNNGANSWSDSTDPSAANDYVVAVQWLRTPQDAASYTFAGNSLAINTGGGMLHKGTGGTQTYTINNFILNGGLVRSGAGSANVMKIAGNLSVSGTGSTIQPDQSPFLIDSVISGTGNLTTNGGYSVTFNGASTLTGNLTVSSAVASASADTLKKGTYLSGTSQWKFAIGASGTNNTIGGAGKIALGGTFNIDLTGAGTTIGNSWTLVNNATLTETYESTFNLADFISDGGTAGSRLWTRNNGGVFYQFNEATGVLAVINPDSDGDGLADAWEDPYFGDGNGTATVEELALQTGTGDPDFDGANNEAEETAGSDPTLDTSWPVADTVGL